MILEIILYILLRDLLYILSILALELHRVLLTVIISILIKLINLLLLLNQIIKIYFGIRIYYLIIIFFLFGSGRIIHDFHYQI